MSVTRGVIDTPVVVLIVANYPPEVVSLMLVMFSFVFVSFIAELYTSAQRIARRGTCL